MPFRYNGFTLKYFTFGFLSPFMKPARITDYFSIANPTLLHLLVDPFSIFSYSSYFNFNSLINLSISNSSSIFMRFWSSLSSLTVICVFFTDLFASDLFTKHKKFSSCFVQYQKYRQTPKKASSTVQKHSKSGGI